MEDDPNAIARACSNIGVGQVGLDELDPFLDRREILTAASGQVVDDAHVGAAGVQGIHQV